MPTKQNSKVPTTDLSQCANKGNSPNAKYAVGYRRPPLHSRFKPGQSGNLKGRPAGRPNVKSMIERVIHQKLPVRQGEKTRKMPMFEAIRRHPRGSKPSKVTPVPPASSSTCCQKPGYFSIKTFEARTFSTVPYPSRHRQQPPIRELFENVDLMLLSDDEKIELSRLAEIVDLGGDMTALSISDFGRAREIVNKGRGKDITPKA